MGATLVHRYPGWTRRRVDVFPHLTRRRRNPTASRPRKADAAGSKERRRQAFNSVRQETLSQPVNTLLHPDNPDRTLYRDEACS